MGLSIGIYIFVATVSVIDFEEPYDPGETLVVRVAGCDIDVVPASSPTVRLDRYLSTGSSHFISYAASGDAAWRVEVSNTGCERLPRLECRRLCLVTIGVPSSGTRPSLLIQQRTGPCWALQAHASASCRVLD